MAQEDDPFAYEVSPPALPVGPEDDDVIIVRASRKQAAIDRRSYDISVNSDAGTIAAGEAIARLPGVVTDIDGSFSILGEKNISYIVEGAYFPREIALEIPAKQIERIEVITNPGAAEKSGGVTINIILRKEISNPRSLSLSGHADSRDRYKAFADFQRETDVWKSFVQLSAKSDMTRSSSTRQTVYPDPEEPGDTGTQLSSFARQYDNLFLMSLFTRKLDGGGQINFGPYGGMNRVSSEGGRDFTLLENNTALEVTTDRGFRESESHNLGFNIGYSKKTPGDDFSVILSFGGGQGDEIAGEDYQLGAVAGTFDRFSERSSDNWSIRATRKVKRPGGAEVKYGLTWQEQSKTEEFGGIDSLYPDNPLIGGDSGYDLAKASAYASVQFRLGDWTVLPGLRHESIEADIRSNGVDSIRKASFDGLLPSLHVSRSFEDFGEVKASVARRVVEPLTAAFLDPARRQTGYRYFTQNDPDIGYGERLNYEISHEWAPGKYKILSTLFHRDIDDGIATITEYLGQDQYLFRRVNLDKEQSGLNVNVKRTVSPKFDYTIDLSVFDNREAWTQNGQEFSTDDTYFTVKANSTYRFTDQRSLVVTTQYTDENMRLTNTNSGQFASSFKFVQKLPNNLSFTVEAIDFLASDTRRVDFVSPTLEQTTVTDKERRGLRLSLSKRF